MKKSLRVLLVCFLVILVPKPVIASDQNPGNVLIVELQTGSNSSASEEFIEIYNTTSYSIDINTWRLEYYSAGSTIFTVPSRTINLHGILYPGGRHLSASSGYLSSVSNESFSAGLAKAGGHLRLVKQDPSNPSLYIQEDLVGWGTAVQPETLSAPSPFEGTSINRKIDINGEYIDTNNNSLDLDINSIPSPESSNINPGLPPEELDPEPLPEEPPVEPDEQVTPPEPLPETPAQTSNQLSPIINELLPNPASPLTDDQDEFIEIYNPNDSDFDFFEYKLQTGNSFSYSFIFEHTIIGPKSFMTFYVKDTNLILSNTSGQARLVDPSGITVSTTSPYEDADDGQSWSLDSDGVWKWSAQPTPSITNVIIQPILITSTKQSSSKVSKPKKAAVSNVKAAKASKAKKSINSTTSTDNPPEVQTVPALHPVVLAVVGVLALLYAGYEYRHDFANKLYQFKRYRKSRRDNR